MSKDLEALSREDNQATKVVEDASLRQLFLSMNEVISSRQPKDKKAFLKNELKLKPIIDVPKHSFKDSCSSIAIIDFSLMQAAFRYFTKISDSNLVKDDLQHVPKSNDIWKDHYFLESELDAFPNGTSEESDLEKALVDLQMSEISNDISDPELQELCKGVTSVQSFSDPLCSLPEDSSLELSPKKPPIVTNGHLIIKKGVKRKKLNAYSKRKKSKKVKLLSKIDCLKPLLRNTKKLSSDSSEDGIVPCIVEPSLLSAVEINPFTSEPSSANNLDLTLASDNLTSPINNTVPSIVNEEKGLKCSILNKSKPKISITKKVNSKLTQICKPLPRNAEKPNSSVGPLIISVAPQNEPSEDEKRSHTFEEAKHNSLNKTSEQFVVACSEALIKTNNVVKNDSARSISSCESIIQTINDVVENNPTTGISSCESINQTINDVVESDQARSISLQTEQHINESNCIDTHTLDCNPVENQIDQEIDFSCAGNTNSVPRDANCNSSLMTSEECKDTSNFQEQNALDFTEENVHTSNKDSPVNQDSQIESQTESNDSLQSQLQTPKEAVVIKSAVETSLSCNNFDQDTELDYEYVLDLSETESLEEHYIRVNSERHPEVEDRGSYYAKKNLHLTENFNRTNAPSNRYNGEVANEREVQESSYKCPVNGNQLDSNVSPSVTRSSRAESEENSEEMVLSSENEKIFTMPDVSKDVDMRKEFMAFQKHPAVVYSDDDSNSDSEQSFKRRVNNISSPSQKRISEKRPSSSPFNFQQVVPGQSIRTLPDCLNHINYHSKNNINEAVNIAGQFLPVSDKQSCNKIFKVLFLGIKKYICLTKIIPDDAVKEAFNLLKKHNTNSSWLYSLIICEYFEEPLLLRFAIDLCTVCREGNIPIEDDAIQAYINNAMSICIPVPILLEFLDYVKRVCKLNFPKPLLCQLLERVPDSGNFCLVPEFKHLCNLLCSLNSDEFEEEPLLKFVTSCIKIDCWDQVARFFQAWSGTGDLSDILLKALQFRMVDAGLFFKKLAAALYRNGEQDLQCTRTFGYIGIILMMKTYFKGKMDDESCRNVYMVNAFEVLHTLQEYNINLYCLNESYYTSELANRFSIDPFNIVFIAIEICICLERPKDAYSIIKGYLPYATTQHLPGIDPQNILSIRLEHFKYFVQLIQMLHHTDPLNAGLKSLLDLLEFLNQEDVDHLMKESADINLEVIRTLFNEYLVLNLNKKLKENVLKLYQHFEGPCKALLTLDRVVLRGVVVFLSQIQKMEEARSLFEVGCIRNIYQFKKKTTKEDFPWKITIKSHWTSQEMKLIIERFLKSLFPVLMDKKTNIDFNNWYTVKILFQEFHCTPSKINCLMEQFAASENTQSANYTIEYAMRRACSILNSIDPDFTWEENKDHILLSPSAFYNYWKKNHVQSKEKPFQVSATKALNFGESNASVAGANAASFEMEGDHSPRSKTSPFVNSSPLRHHLTGEEVSSTTSDLIARKRASRSSSERSTSSHVSERDFSSRVPQPFLFRSPISTLVGKNTASPRKNVDLQVSPRFSQSPQQNWSPRKTPQEMESPANVPFPSPKQANKTTSPGRFTSVNGGNPTAIMDMDKNGTGDSSMSLPPQKTNSVNSSPVEDTDQNTLGKKVCSPRNMNDRTNFKTVPSMNRCKGAVSSLVNHSPELSVFSEPPVSKLKGRNQLKKKIKKVRPRKLQSIPNGASVGNNLNAAVEKMPPIPRSDPSVVNESNAAAPADERLCSNSSLENHSPELPHFEEPPKPVLKAKRRLNLKKEVEPSLPPYRIQTPCKQARVIRPITPSFKSFNTRCKTPISFTSAPKLNPQVKRPIPNTAYTNFVVTVGSANSKTVTSRNNSKNSILFPTATAKAVNGPMFQNLKGNSCAKQSTGENFQVTRNFNFKIPQARRLNDVPENDYQKILTFLKSKVMLKCKTSSPGEQEDKANSLANTFIKNNTVQHLDAKTRKLLFKFAEECIY